LSVCMRRPVVIVCALVGFAVAFAQGSSAAPRAAELGAEAPLATSGGFVGRITGVPAHGSVGASVTISGEGFPAGQALNAAISIFLGVKPSRQRVSAQRFRAMVRLGLERTGGRSVDLVKWPRLPENPRNDGMTEGDICR
jgi:hypothetical protein